MGEGGVALASWQLAGLTSGLEEATAAFVENQSPFPRGLASSYLLIKINLLLTSLPTPTP